jgi:hypothetical protein
MDVVCIAHRYDADLRYFVILPFGESPWRAPSWLFYLFIVQTGHHLACYVINISIYYRYVRIYFFLKEATAARLALLVVPAMWTEARRKKTVLAKLQQRLHTLINAFKSFLIYHFVQHVLVNQNHAPEQGSSRLRDRCQRRHE